MAFASMLRRASSSLLPRAIRAVGSPRTFRTAVSTVEKQSLAREIARRGFTSPLRFSTAVVANKDNLVRVLDAEIECAEEPNDSDVPSGFPFAIEDIEGERTITLTRKFEGEIIKVDVDMLSVDGDEEDDLEEDGDKIKDNAKQDDHISTTSIPLVVTISKGSGQQLEFGITAFPDEVSIDSLSIKSPSSSDDQLPYEGPDFCDLDENLQKAFLKYLEIRGINPNTTNFLIDYMANKDNREYMNWLNNIKKFVRK